MDPWPCHSPPRLDTQKKTLAASERNATKRDEFRARIQHRPAADFVIVDEMGSNLNLTPRYGRAPRGERARGSVPRNTPANTTLIASMSMGGMGAAMVLSGATDRAAFEVYVEHFLLPTLVPGQVVVWDNLSAHTSNHVRQLIAGRGCEVWPLPAYSPDFSPIEEAFSKLKAGLRRAQARSGEALMEAIANGLNAVTAADARGYFTHCGYRLLPDQDL
jgi:transposase